MQFKTQTKELRQIDVSEWNSELVAYFKTPCGVEALVFNDLWIEFRDKHRTAEERVDAGFAAAKLTMVDEAGNALLAEEDRDLVKQASLDPIFRVFTYGLDDDFIDERFKKN